jgi:hypothetical protein
MPVHAIQITPAIRDAVQAGQPLFATAKAETRLAPNGKPSRLNPAQHRQVRTPEFKAWFGDWESFASKPSGVWADDAGAVSKVVDDNGEPLVVYHGTERGGFTVFDPTKRNRNHTPSLFFSDDPGTAASYTGSFRPPAQPMDREAAAQSMYGKPWAAKMPQITALAEKALVALAKSITPQQTADRPE